MEMQEMMDKAIEFAARAHAGQRRKGGDDIPFIVHPFGVAMLLKGAGAPDKAVAAGLLHDTVEDTEVTLDEVRSIFGNEVADIVDGCTEKGREKGDSSERHRATWRERKKHSLESIRKARPEVKLVACADKLDNMRAIARACKEQGDSVWGRFNNSDKSEQAWYYRGMVESLRPLGRGVLDAVLRKLWVELEWEVGELFGQEYGHRQGESRQDVRDMLEELGKIGNSRQRKVLLYLSAGENVRPEYVDLPFDYVILSDYTYGKFEVRDKKVVMMPYDNNRTIQYLVAAGIQVNCIVAINDGCCEGGNYECVNSAEFFRKLRPVLADECFYVRDHVNGFRWRRQEEEETEEGVMFGPYLAKEVPKPDFVKYTFPDQQGVQSFNLKLDRYFARQGARHE